MDNVQMIIRIPRVLPPLAQSGLLYSERSEEDCQNKPVTPRRSIQKKGRGFPGDSDGEESACNAGDLGSIPGLGRSPGEGNGNPLQYSCLKKIPWTEKPGGLQSMRSQRVGYD